MSHVQAMFEAVEFVEGHLKQEVAVADIAEAVSFSLYHFCRTFNRVIHHTPYDYLMRRRLSESARDLMETGRRIIDIAFDYQFNSPETYSRAFKRMFGVQPNQWKRHGRIDPRRFMSRLTLEHIQQRNRGAWLKPVLAERPRLQIAGLMTLVQEDRTVIAQLWDLLGQELERIGATAESERYYGISWYPRNWEDQAFFYLAGIETASLDTSGSALVTRTIPPQKYARFIHKGPLDRLDLTLDYIYQTWLPKSGQHLSLPLELVSFGQDFRAPDHEETERAVYIPITW